MKALFKTLALLALLAAVIFSLWYYRPWSDYSPAKIASLQHPEKLVWNMQNMAQLVPSKPVLHQVATELAGTSRPLVLEYQFNGQTRSLEDFLQASTTAGLLVIQGGEVQHERYLQGAARETLFTSWSVAKSFVATALAMAEREGRIKSLDDRVEEYATQFAGTDYGASRIRDLLFMSSGIDFKENYSEGVKSDVRPFFFDSFILGKNPDELLFKFKRSRAPLSDFDYISSNSHVLSAVLRGAYQQPLPQIISEKLWQPLGMEADANWLLHRADEQGVALGYCCLNARLRDYGRFGQFMLQAVQGRGLGADVLPEGWAQSLAEPPTVHHQSGGDRYSGRGYSQHFWLPIDAVGVFFAAGIYGQYIWVDAANDLVIVRTSSDPDWTARYPESEAVFKAITEHFAVN